MVFPGFERADGSRSAEKAFAQLDTGMADVVWQRSVYVNDALWSQIKTTEAVKVGVLNVRQCDGSGNLEAWVLPETRLQITDEKGAWMIKYPAFYVVPLKNAAAGSACGGISTMTVPAAQIGAYFLRSLGTIIIDPMAYGDGGGVWIKMPTPAQP